MRKSVVVSMFIVATLLFSEALFSDEGKHDKTIDEVIEFILEDQGLEDESKIDPDKVSDDLLEQLGEAYMSWMHPNEEQHQWMDNMMGGEGSESLRQAHIRMGYSYLDSSSWGYCGRGVMGGPGVMNWWRRRR